MNLTRYEQETIINFNEEETTAIPTFPPPKSMILAPCSWAVVSIHPPWSWFR